MLACLNDIDWPRRGVIITDPSKVTYLFLTGPQGDGLVLVEHVYPHLAVVLVVHGER